ncbi:MAG TPA: carboxypeptidase regulatory-like domain-containing protein [Longimicrobiales bacterium]|nr:carboxypeptidase regulatory-like domain-containing protein [Longimicrobiales bacterium]
MFQLVSRPATAIVAAALLGLAAGVEAQETRGAIAGRVVAEDGSALAGGEIVATGPSLIGRRIVASQDDGRFRIAELPPGPYTLEVRRLGHQTVRVENVLVPLGGIAFPLGGRIVLPTAAVALAPLVVAADAAAIDFSSAAVETSIRGETFRAVPTGRDYRSLAILVPEATLSYRDDPVNISGATGLENLSYVDGFNTTDPFVGALGTKLPYNFVREFQVKSNGYAAEYGGATGGIFNAVTHSGGDQWTASTFGYVNSAGMTADSDRAAGELQADGADEYDFGVAVGGPLVRDRLWFFGAYDPTFATNRVHIPGHGSFDDELTEHLFAGKLNWRAGGRTDAVLTVFGDPSTHDRVGGGPFSSRTENILDADVMLNRVERGGVNVASQLTHRIGDRAVLDLLLGGQWTSFFDGPRPGDDAARYDCQGEDGECDPGVPTGALGGGFGEEFAYEGRRYSARLTAAFGLGSHNVKLGAEYEQYALGPFSAFNSGEGVILDFGPQEPVDTQPPDPRYQVIVQERVADLEGRAPIFYAQDSWQLGDALHINYGLRWDGQYVIDSEGDVAQSFTDQWQPRFGVVWSPGEPGVQKVTASAGRFYHRMALRLAAGFYAGSEGSTNWVADFDGDPREGGQEIEGTRITFCCTIQPERDLRGTHFDEVTLGYERALGTGARLGVRGIHRNLREVVNVGRNPEGSLGFRDFPGNPGRGDLSNLDRPQRNYWALELTGDWASEGRAHFSGSYVLSRSYGNFPGVYNSDSGQLFPNENGVFALERSMPNNKGPLPNDRTHRLKLWGSYGFAFGLTAGTFLAVESGTPLSRREVLGVGTRSRFLTPRGSEGRLPTLWDLNLRLQYPVFWGADRGRRANLVLDALHIGNPQTVVWQDDVATFVSAGQVIPQPSFGEPQAYQEPFALRLGVEFDF